MRPLMDNHADPPDRLNLRAERTSSRDQVAVATAPPVLLHRAAPQDSQRLLRVPTVF